MGLLCFFVLVTKYGYVYKQQISILVCAPPRTCERVPHSLLDLSSAHSLWQQCVFFSTLHNDIMVVSVTSRCCCDYVIFSKQHGCTVAESEARSRNQGVGQYASLGSYNAIQGDLEVLAHLAELRHKLEWRSHWMYSTEGYGTCWKWSPAAILHTSRTLIIMFFAWGIQHCATVFLRRRTGTFRLPCMHLLM